MHVTVLALMQRYQLLVRAALPLLCIGDPNAFTQQDQRAPILPFQAIWLLKCRALTQEQYLDDTEMEDQVSVSIESSGFSPIRLSVCEIAVVSPDTQAEHVD